MRSVAELDRGEERQKSRTVVDFIIQNDQHEEVYCTFRQLFDYSGDLYVAFEDQYEDVHILRVKNPYSEAPTLVEVPEGSRSILRKHYLSIIGEMHVEF
ncbi:hypothetical protein J2T17_004407 [Paenibacillus mucilaginosus]|uniref:hypothetical protein n=1 Tax=Paenibacillus mucilaginosus TaxID=61624 RepID=UPI003D21E3C9